jgi:hypothetical protein
MAGTVPDLTGLMRRLRSADKELEEPYTRILFFNPAPAGFSTSCEKQKRHRTLLRIIKRLAVP